MSTIRQRNMFADSRDQIPIHSYETLDELLEVPFVKRRKESSTFLKFSMSRREGTHQYLLMFEETNGKFWVVGYCSDDIPELPEWNHEECRERERLYNETSN